MSFSEKLINHAKYGRIDSEKKELILDELKEIEGMMDNAEEMASQMDEMCRIIGSVGSIFNAMSDADVEFCKNKLDLAREAYLTQEAMLKELYTYWNPLPGYWEGTINAISLSDFQQLYRSVSNKYRKIVTNYYEMYRLYSSLAKIKFVPDKISPIKPTGGAKDIMNKAIMDGCFVFYLKDDTESPSECATHPDKKSPQNISSHSREEVSTTSTPTTDNIPIELEPRTLDTSETASSTPNQDDVSSASAPHTDNTPTEPNPRTIDTAETASSTPNRNGENSGIKYNLINSLYELIVYDDDSMYVRKFGFFNNKLKEEKKITHNDISSINLKKRDNESKKSSLSFSIGFSCYLFELPASNSNNELLDEICLYLGGKK